MAVLVPYKTYDIGFVKTVDGFGNLTLEAVDSKNADELYADFGTITIDIGAAPSHDKAYFNTADYSNMLEYLIEHGWAKTIGASGQNGEIYPLVQFSSSFLQDVCCENHAEVEQLAERAEISHTSVSKSPKPGESFEEWLARASSAETKVDTITLYIPCPSETLESERVQKVAEGVYTRAFKSAGIELFNLRVIPSSDYKEMGAGAYVTVPIESYEAASQLGREVYLELNRVHDNWWNVNLGNIGSVKDAAPVKDTNRKVRKMAEEVKKEFVNVEFPASKVKHYENKETGEKFCKCYFPDGMEVAGQDMTGYYLNPKPEFIRPSALRLGASTWGYANDPDKKVWAMKDVKNEDGSYTHEHVELEPAAIEKACRDWMDAPENKQFITVDASRVHERTNSQTNKTFFSVNGPSLNVDGVNLSRYSFTANFHTKPFTRDGVEKELVGFNAVAGEKIRMTPPKDMEDAKPVYIPAETIAKGFNADINRAAKKDAPEKAETKEKVAAHAAPAKAVSQEQTKQAPAQSR